MRRRTIVLSTVIGLGALAWVLLDADPEGRQALADRIADAFGTATEEPLPPNWGDVATKVGEFTEADRDLREVLNPALAPGDESVPSVGAADE